MSEAIVLTTPTQIELASWLALRGALKLECKGITRRGKTANTIACDRLGLRRGTHRAKTLAILAGFIKARFNFEVTP